MIGSVPASGLPVARSAPRMLAGGSFHSLALGAGAWLCVALVSAAQGHVYAVHAGRPQPWWPAFIYTLAIFSVWAGLAPAMMHLARRAFRLRPAARTMALILGLPLVTIVHVAIFVAIFQPLYGVALDGWQMAQRVLAANVDNAVFAYALIVATAFLRLRKDRRRDGIDPVADPVSEPEIGLWVRDGGVARLLEFDQIDWVAAAGDYVEIHAANHAVLADHSLQDVEAMLRGQGFARIHRSAIVNLAKIRKVRRLGRGDAELRLANGVLLRLSRRYRANVAASLPL